MSKPQTKCTEEKFSEIFSVANVFSKHFQSLSRDNWSFSKKVPAWLSQLPSTGPEEHFGITIWGKFLNISIFFGKSVKFPRKHRKIIFRVDRTAKSVWRKKLRKNLFQEKKTYYFNFFHDFARSLFAINEKLTAWLSKLQPKYLQKFLKKNSFFLKIEHDCNLFRTLRSKK